ncbi:helix-turn-helix transcriptional regulator [Rothia sp. (in: high G+C Gram-positive bacteria)]|uniref:heat shock protein transcriptional repressor HspR n=1 Tax=Rothia sp. (in: high G+C Gram-positive bacteria) TaxID=1885016 RepID=UPI000EDFCBD4|nr:heat-shock protein [Rothia sp. (in: high G+C Gram-positive bacteria)]
MALESDRPVFVISVAAELAGMHPQTLRQYDRLGLVQPSRAPGKARRYSERDVQKLQEIQDLSQSGVSLEGIKRIIDLERQVEALKARNAELLRENEALIHRLHDGSRVFAAGVSGDIVHLARGKRSVARPHSQAMVLYRPKTGK